MLQIPRGSTVSIIEAPPGCQTVPIIGAVPQRVMNQRLCVPNTSQGHLSRRNLQNLPTTSQGYPSQGNYQYIPPTCQGHPSQRNYRRIPTTSQGLPFQFNYQNVPTTSQAYPSQATYLNIRTASQGHPSQRIYQNIPSTSQGYPSQENYKNIPTMSQGHPSQRNNLSIPTTSRGHPYQRNRQNIPSTSQGFPSQLNYQNIPTTSQGQAYLHNYENTPTTSQGYPSQSTDRNKTKIRIGNAKPAILKKWRPVKVKKTPELGVLEVFFKQLKRRRIEEVQSYRRSSLHMPSTCRQHFAYHSQDYHVPYCTGCLEDYKEYLARTHDHDTADGRRCRQSFFFEKLL